MTKDQIRDLKLQALYKLPKELIQEEIKKRQNKLINKHKIGKI